MIVSVVIVVLFIGLCNGVSYDAKSAYFNRTFVRGTYSRVGCHAFKQSYIGRIIGLDPALVGPEFIDMRAVDKLKPTDAKFVDVIHSDGLKLEHVHHKNVGHIDLTGNDSYNHPGCCFALPFHHNA